MGEKQKMARAERRFRCFQIGRERLELLRTGALKHEDFRASILDGDCPLCGESGFKSIAGHFWNIHEISSRELRDEFGFTYSESICSVALHEKLSALNADKVPSALGKSDPSKRRYSTKGKKIRDANLGPPLKWVTKDVLRENGKRAGKLRKGCDPWNKTHKHGTRAMFRRGCRCDSCDAANKAYWRSVNARRSKPSNA